MKFHSHLQNVSRYEAGKPLDLLMREFNIKPQDIIKLGSNENPFGPSPKVIRAIIDNVRLASVYPDDSYHELKESLAAIHGVDSRNIIIGSGSDEIIEFCTYAKGMDGFKSLSAKYTFAMYEIYTRLYGGEIITTSDFYHNLDEMFQSYKQNKPSIIFICTPNNPLGEALHKKKVLEFIQKVDEDTLIVLDCAYMEFASFKDEEYGIKPGDVVEFNNVIYLGTFSKVYGLGGMRVGYGIAHNEIIESINKVRAPFNVTILSLVAANAALKDQEFIRDTLENNFKEMSIFEDFARENNIEYINSYGNFITFLCDKLSSTEISNSLLKKGIIIRDLKSYNLNGIRITIGLKEHNKILLDSLYKLLR